MKGTLTIDGVTVEIQLTEEQVKQVSEAMEPKEKKITWEELEIIDGYFPSCMGNIEYEHLGLSRTTFKTQNQARAVLAMAKLSQLMAHKYYNGDWVPNWKYCTLKYVIECYGGKAFRECYSTNAHFLAFKDEETRDRFLDHHRELIEEYFLLYQ